MEATEFWQERYAAQPKVWSGQVNHFLAELAGPLTAGRVLDLGCGEGGDAIWLASRGWRVTAVDISTVALDRGRAAAEEAGLPENSITWVATDLTEWTPEETYDLVTACFLQSPLPLSRAEILRSAAQTITPGGHLLIVSHAAPPPWASESGHQHDFPRPADELAALALANGEWERLIAEVRPRTATGPDGQSALLEDSVIFLRRADVGQG